MALSHGSYAQVVAALPARVPAVTMMDYEHQPANHLCSGSPARDRSGNFPEARLGVRGAAKKVVRYQGFKEELYLADFGPDPSILESLGLDPVRVTAAMRPPPEGALYHAHGNPRFDAILDHVLPEEARSCSCPNPEQAARYRGPGVAVPERPVDGSTLLATVDLAVGAGGTMTRESALLGTPTYTVFLGELAAQDAELIRLGRIVDLRSEGALPAVERRPNTRNRSATAAPRRSSTSCSARSMAWRDLRLEADETEPVPRPRWLRARRLG